MSGAPQRSARPKACPEARAQLSRHRGEGEHVNAAERATHERFSGSLNSSHEPAELQLPVNQMDELLNLERVNPQDGLANTAKASHTARHNVSQV